MTEQGIKKPKQYTIKGIKLGRFDDDLDRLLRVVQRRRADLGQIKVIRVGPSGFVPETIQDSPIAENSGPDQSPVTYAWPYNQDKLSSERANVLDFIHAHLNDDEMSQKPLTRYNYNRYGTVNVDGTFFAKSELEGRIVTCHDTAAAETGLAALYVKSVARRNLTCFPLMASRLTSPRKYSAVRKKSAEGATVVIPPENLADVYTTDDALKWLIRDGETGINV